MTAATAGDGSAARDGGPNGGATGDTAAVLASAEVVSIPLRHRFRGILQREGVLLRGPAGWGEFAPFREYSDADCVPWLRAALEAAQDGWPAPVRDRFEVNAIVPVLDPDRAAALVAASGCRTAKVKVAEPGVPLSADAERVAAVRQALGTSGRIRVDANGAWTEDAAVAAIRVLDRAAGQLEYVEQPCRSIPELAAVRRRVDVAVAADESIRRERDPLEVVRADAADIAVVKVAPLGGVRAALRIAEQTGLPVVVSSAVDTAVGLAAGAALAGALPELPFACGLGTGSLLAADVSSAAVRPDAGRLPVPRAAPEPDLRSRVVADLATRRWWLGRLARVAALL
ncbi:o-succinylbenzoate synthase [Nakamurella endophytica]|uniref:o-succinylbenzoate synthase n=1 Tax=Nakamurella endophytica TaxID=1748367 RepID=A0A917SYL1_9ACTN|nr:o-succinylbenzoate synthase [Nakamurella endophytica]GGM03848.1 o-succinylbenzoate synthase [Nakamurella endophytica]